MRRSQQKTGHNQVQEVPGNGQRKSRITNGRCPRYGNCTRKDLKNNIKIKIIFNREFLALRSRSMCPKNNIKPRTTTMSNFNAKPMCNNKWNLSAMYARHYVSTLGVIIYLVISDSLRFTLNAWIFKPRLYVKLF